MVTIHIAELLDQSGPVYASPVRMFRRLIAILLATGGCYLLDILVRVSVVVLTDHSAEISPGGPAFVIGLLTFLTIASFGCAVRVWPPRYQRTSN
jgi:hypothetical protein